MLATRLDIAPEKSCSKKKDSILFQKEHIERAEDFMKNTEVQDDYTTHFVLIWYELLRQ